MDNYNIIKSYLSDTDNLYRNWYKKKLLQETGLSEGNFTGIFPEIINIEQMFNNWLLENNNILRKKICIEWGYFEKRNKYFDDIELIKEMAGYLSFFIDFPVEVATKLFISGLDVLCHS